MKERLHTEVVPTLFIGLGGTGAEVLLRIRRRILNTFWGSNAVGLKQLSEFPLAEFLQIDTDIYSFYADNEARRHTKSDFLSEKISFKEGEKLVEKLDLMKYFKSDDDLANHPLVQEWFPYSRRQLNALNLSTTHGAGQLRFMGRLYVFDKYQAIKNAIREKADRLLSNVSSADAQKRLELTMKTGKLKIVVIASTAGGTGSGSFIDMGYIVNLLGKQAAPEGVDTNLVLTLPTGYSNSERTQANTYAALMELETSMRQGSRYVKGWSQSEIEIGGGKLSDTPYSDVYLVDTENLGGAKTAKITDVYDMIADALFEDFSTAEFANKKRSISVNQNQHKIVPYASLVVDSYGDMKLTFSRAYSSFGQATIDMHLEQKRNAIILRQVNNMLKSFFGVSAEDTRSNAPTEQERDALLKSIYLGIDNVVIDYDFVTQTDQYRKGIERTTYPIVSELLRVNGVSRLDDIEKKITETFETIRTSDSYKEWASKIAQAIKQIKYDTVKAVVPGSGMHEDAIKKRRRELLEELMDANRGDGLIKALWARVDNKERGGLDYTIQLIQRLKDRMEHTHTGLINTLQENTRWFSELSDYLRNEEITTLQEHLRQAMVKFMGAQSQSVAKLKQISNAVRLYVRYHLYAVASREAAVLLKELSDALGKQQGTDSDGNPVWSGFMGQLDEGRGMVRAIIADAEQQIALTDEAMKQGHAMYFVLPAPPSKLDELKLLPPQQAREWAEEAFQDFGGTQALFDMLKDDNGKSELLGKLSNRALSMIGGENSADVENPLFVALENHPNRSQLFADFLQRAMPWVAAKLAYLKPTSPEDQYKCVIGVKDAKKFEERFGNELKSRLPSSAVMTANQISFVEIDQPEKLVCYVELSGIPLASIKALDDWYSNYKGENEKIPVHTHAITSTFVHPRELTTDELASRAEDFKLFVQAVALGVLTRVEHGDAGLYQLIVKDGKHYVGDEKLLRQSGLYSPFRGFIKEQLEIALDELKNTEQLAIWVALMKTYSDLIYPTLIHRDTEKGDAPMNTFPTVLCEQLATEWRARLDAVTGDTKVAEQLMQKARDAINQWTVEIAGSETDVYAHEVGEDHKPKRVLKREVLQEGWSWKK